MLRIAICDDEADELKKIEDLVRAYDDVDIVAYSSSKELAWDIDDGTSFDLYLLDVFLVRMEQVGVPALIGMNKVDVDDGANTEWIHEIYKRSGYPILFFSVKEGENMNVLKECLAHKTTVLAGPSGVGKSSLTNYLHPSAGMEVGALSGKGGRGKHTTRHSELFALDGCYVMDTPGFSSLEPPKMAAGELKECIPEFAPYGTNCKYLDCVHVGERDCAVKKAVEEGGIHEARYGNYVKMFETLKQGERFV